VYNKGMISSEYLIEFDRDNKQIKTKWLQFISFQYFPNS